MNNGAHYQYKKRQVEGVDQGTLIIMLYDGAIKFLNFSIEAIDADCMEGAHNNLVRGQAIINELVNSLKVDAGEVAVNLLRLYEFMNRQLSAANAKKDKAVINSVIGLLKNLREGWVGVINKLKAEAKGENSSDQTDDSEKGKKVQLNVSV